MINRSFLRGSEQTGACWNSSSDWNKEKVCGTCKLPHSSVCFRPRIVSSFCTESMIIVRFLKMWFYLLLWKIEVDQKKKKKMFSERTRKGQRRWVIKGSFFFLLLVCLCHPPAFPLFCASVLSWREARGTAFQVAWLLTIRN